MTRVKAPKYIRENQWAGHPNPLWHRRDKKKVTVLYNMFEQRKSLFMRAYFERSGYNYRDLGRHKAEDVYYGREWGTRMMCNPAYFTSGTFIHELLEIEKKEGLTKEQIVDRFVFVGGGGDCGPCRFGIYPQEYIHIANDAGFKGFRVLIVNPDIVKIPPDPKNSAFTCSLSFLLQFTIAIVLADLIHIGECAVLPYAKDREAAINTIKECEDLLFKALRNPLFMLTLPVALYKAGKKLAAIPRDEKKLPLIFVTGEVFSNYANGDANYNLRRFIIDEGCEVLPCLFTHRSLYECWRKKVLHRPSIKFSKSIKEKLYWMNFANMETLAIGTILFVFHFFSMFFNQKQFGGKGAMHNLNKLSALAEPYYDKRIMGGEGNMEIAEALYYHDKVDGFISIKPFGCMPSSGVSDGVQSKIISMYPDFNFLSIETSGDNEVNILSRVSMMLFKAKQKIRPE